MSVAADWLAALLTLTQVPAGLIPDDARIRTVTFSPGQVVSLAVAPGYAAVVALGPSERVESIVVGNSAEWQVTASKRGDDVVVKPLSGATSTNMVITTGDRHYIFELTTGSGDATTYVMRFVYSDAAPAPLAAVHAPTLYRFSGARALMPIDMSDDGVRTTIIWGKDTPLPAIFAIARDGHEALVNGRMVDGAFVVEQVAKTFVFRLGTARATAIRRSSGPHR